VVLGFGSAVLAAALLGASAAEALYMAAAASLMHPVIDRLSHGRSRRGVYRTKTLHSFETLLPLAAAAGFIVGWPLGFAEALRAAAAFVASAASHLLADMTTPGGVYFAGRRVRYLAFRWDDPGANVGFMLAGMAMALTGLAIAI
jgi:membrane-bound metal-dependent hydrolase YbcI (DUF457 family)